MRKITILLPVICLLLSCWMAGSAAEALQEGTADSTAAVTEISQEDMADSTAAVVATSREYTAGSTVITAVVPSTHTLTVEAENVAVSYGGETGTSFEIPRLEEIEATLKAVLVSKSGYPEGNTVVYEVTLVVSTDGGETWAVATTEQFPEDGLTVSLPYPSGTAKDTHDFAATHMFTSTAFGKTPGNRKTWLSQRPTTACR